MWSVTETTGSRVTLMRKGDSAYIVLVFGGMSPEEIKANLNAVLDGLNMKEAGITVEDSARLTPEPF
jgi:hypothetical protein